MIIYKQKKTKLRYLNKTTSACMIMDAVTHASVYSPESWKCSYARIRIRSNWRHGSYDFRSIHFFVFDWFWPLFCLEDLHLDTSGVISTPVGSSGSRNAVCTLKTSSPGPATKSSPVGIPPICHCHGFEWITGAEWMSCWIHVAILQTTQLPAITITFPLCATAASAQAACGSRQVNFSSGTRPCVLAGSCLLRVQSHRLRLEEAIHNYR